MQRLEVSGAVQPIYGSLGVKRLRNMYIRHVTIKVRFYLRLRFACRLCL